MDPLRICHVSSEIAPFAKTGGLADVAAGLGRYLGAAGHDVRLFLPLYARIRNGGHRLTPSVEQRDMALTMGGTKYRFNIQTTPLPGSDTVHVYLVDCPELYDRDDIYTDDDDAIRFAFLGRAVLESCQRMRWGPDVFHLNDWHTGLLPLYLGTGYAWDALFRDSHTLLAIHNIGYQGVFPSKVLPDLDLMAQRRHLPQADLDNGVVNYLRTGLEHADALSTVSRTYAAEIQTSEYGMGLEDLLRRRRDDLTGIVNGVDYGDWNPEADPLIPHPFSAADMAGKAKDKQALLEELGLPHDPAVPVVGIVSRLTGQKGFELLEGVLPPLLEGRDLRLAVLGSGEARLESYFEGLVASHPGKVAFRKGYDNGLAHRIEAGADMFLMPSRYEPCGLNQMYSLRYGTVPIVRRTGGLADTVEPFDPATGRGTGFLFQAFDAGALLGAVTTALSVWKMRTVWPRVVQNGMAQDFSWERQGPHYEALYRSLVGVRA